MFYFLHKHMRAVGILVFLFICIPLAFWGIGFETPDAEGVLATATVAQVGSTPISAQAFYREYSNASQQSGPDGIPLTAEEMVANGAVEAILDRMINDALLRNAGQAHNVRPEQTYLVKKLKDDPAFQTEGGEFDAGYFNQWVQSMNRRGVKWDDIYASVATVVNQSAFAELYTGSARVPEAEVRDEFEAANTKLRVRYTVIEPPVEIPEEELRAHYEDAKERYLHPEERKALFVAIPLDAPIPPLAGELVTRAREGDDFAELAQEHSVALSSSDGGALGWLTKSDGIADHRKPLFELAEGAVSDPVRGPNGVYIYKVEEVGQTEDGAARVRGRELVLSPKLSEEERSERLDLANDIVMDAREFGNLAAVAEERDLELATTDLFSFESNEIQHVPDADVFAFRSRLSGVGVDQISDPVEAQNNIYVAQVLEVTEPVQQTFEEAREQVERDAVNLYKNGPEYVAELREYLDTIAAETESLDAVAERFPELAIEIKEIPDPFGRDDFLFDQGIYWTARDAFNVLKDRAAGELGGPITDFQRQYYFVELNDREAPSEEDWAERYPEERGEILEELASQRRNARHQDYVLYLNETARDQAMIQKDYDSVMALLGLDEPADQPGSRATDPAPQAPIEVDDTPVEAEDVVEDIEAITIPPDQPTPAEAEVLEPDAAPAETDAPNPER